MKNIMEINNYQAFIQYDPEIEMFRGEFIGLRGGADFYASDIASLRREGAVSLQVYLDMCREEGIEPIRQFSGKFNLRLPPKLHGEITAAAAAKGKSLNQWINDELRSAVADSS